MAADFAGALQQVDDALSVAVASRTPEQAEAFGQRFNISNNRLSEQDFANAAERFLIE